MPTLTLIFLGPLDAEFLLEKAFLAFLMIVSRFFSFLYKKYKKIGCISDEILFHTHNNNYVIAQNIIMIDIYSTVQGQYYERGYIRLCWMLGIVLYIYSVCKSLTLRCLSIESSNFILNHTLYLLVIVWPGEGQANTGHPTHNSTKDLKETEESSSGDLLPLFLRFHFQTVRILHCKCWGEKKGKKWPIFCCCCFALQKEIAWLRTDSPTWI